MSLTKILNDLISYRPSSLAAQQPPAALKELRRLPEVAALIEADDARQLERRRAIRSQMDAGPPAATVARLRKLTADCGAEAKREAELAETLRKSKARLEALRCEIYGVDMQLSGREATLRREMIETADERLGAVIAFVNAKRDVLRHSFWVAPQSAGRDDFGRPIVTYESNHDALTAAQAEVGAVKVEAERLQLEPLPRADVTQRLTVLLARLGAALKAFSIVTPIVDDVGDLVYQPQRTNTEEVDAILQNSGAPSHELFGTHTRERAEADAAIEASAMRGRRVVVPGRLLGE